MSKRGVYNVFSKIVAGGSISIELNDDKILVNDMNMPQFINCDVDCLKLLGKSTQFDGPDAYYLSTTGVLYLIEHFEVDITRKDKKGGSLYKKEASSLDKEVNKIFQSKEDVFLTNSVKINGTVESFVDSMKYSVDKHYNKIFEYKQKVLEELSKKSVNSVTEIKIIFLMENTMPLGVYCGDNGDLLPFEYSNFIEILSDKNEVDYFMYFSYNMFERQKLTVVSTDFLKTIKGVALNPLIELEDKHTDIAFNYTITQEEIEKYINKGE